jgi:hypothetical protein
VLDLVESQPPPNTGYVVVQGSPDDGWTLLDWNGTKTNQRSDYFRSRTRSILQSRYTPYLWRNS